MEKNEKNEEKRELTDAPMAATAKSVREWLLERGAKGILSTSAVANVVGCSKRTVKNAENSGELPSIDKCTYELDSVVQWLLKHPRYMAQGENRFQLTEATYQNVREILLKTSPTLIKLWNNDVDDLVSEVCYQMSRTRVSGSCSEKTIIHHAINNLWHKKSTRQMVQTVSLDAIREAKGCETI